MILTQLMAQECILCGFENIIVKEFDLFLVFDFFGSGNSYDYTAGFSASSALRDLKD